jgi:hypothetical protein
MSRYDERLKARVEESTCLHSWVARRGVYYESIKREPKIRGIKKCRCDKDYKLKQRNLRASHTLGWSWNWNAVGAGLFTNLFDW